MELPDVPHFFLTSAAPTARDLYADIEAPGGSRGDSGIDLRFPTDLDIPPTMALKGLPLVVDLEVRVRCRLRGTFVPYQIVPRSSIGKTPLSLANSIGTIDRGYTGTLKVAIRNHSSSSFAVERGASLFQLVRPDLEPACLVVVGADHPAFAEGASLRGAGGFGSTGVSGAAAPKEPRDPLTGNGGDKK